MLKIPDSHRLRFRLLDPPDDAELLLELDRNPEVMRYINGGKASSLEEIRAISMPRVAQYRNPERGWGIWMTYRQDIDEFLGWILVRPLGFFEDDRDDTNLELGWRFKQGSWGNGYATEAATAVMKALIENGERKFTAIAIPENLASIAVMKKIGMTYLRSDFHQDANLTTPVVYYQRVVD